jgi:Alcohol dehydrogenase GroES-like domain
MAGQAPALLAAAGAPAEDSGVDVSWASICSRLPQSKNGPARHNRTSRVNSHKGGNDMRGVVMHAPGDIRVEERNDPQILYPTDAIIRLSGTCICGSDLWPYRGIEPIMQPTPMGHEYVGVVEQVGSEVKTIKVGDFVVGSFFASDNTCDLPGRLPVPLRARRGDEYDRHPGAAGAHPIGRRHPRRHAWHAGARRDPVVAGSL